MNEIIIVIQTLALSLAFLVLIQVRRQYIKALIIHKESLNAQEVVVAKNEPLQPELNPKKATFSDIPVPEVSFHKGAKPDNKKQHSAILNDYIDDFFDDYIDDFFTDDSTGQSTSDKSQNDSSPALNERQRLSVVNDEYIVVAQTQG